MSDMEPTTTTGRPPVADPHRTQTGADTGEPYVRRFKSVQMPGVAKGPILPDWVRHRLRKLLHRKTTPTTPVPR